MTVFGNQCVPSMPVIIKCIENNTVGKEQFEQFVCARLTYNKNISILAFLLPRDLLIITSESML